MEETLTDASIPSSMINVIMGILSKSTSRLIWNGEVTEAIKPSRGLHQGDTLSPYLFVLCIDRLSRWVHQRFGDGSWRPLRASRGGPTVSHLFFANDILFFVEATDNQVDCILRGVNEFCAASGQKVNFTNLFLPQPFCSSYGEIERQDGNQVH